MLSATSNRFSLPRAPLLLASVLLLGACATGAPPRSVEVKLPPAFDSASQQAQTVALDRWWTLYDDPQLTALVEQALARGFEEHDSSSATEGQSGVGGPAGRSI